MTQMQIHEYPKKPLKLSDSFIKDNQEDGTSRVTYEDMLDDISEKVSSSIEIPTIPPSSEIGSEIVTENVKMITKTFKNISPNTKNQAWIGPFNEETFGISPSDDIVGYSLFGKEIGTEITFNGNMWVENGYFVCNNVSKACDFTINIFVRVPVVEQLPRFTTTIPVTLNGGNAVETGLILDGSENVGGYTIKNFHSITAIAYDGIILPTYIEKGTYKIKVAGVNSGQTGSKQIRITIE